MYAKLKFYFTAKRPNKMNFLNTNKNGSRQAHHGEVETSTIIGKGTTITGDIEAVGNIRIEGSLIGHIRSKAKVVLGQGGIVTGNVFAQNAEIQGEVIGHLYVSEQLILKNTASVKGDIFAQNAQTETGYKHSGHAEIGAIPKEIEQMALNGGATGRKELPQNEKNTSQNGKAKTTRQKA